MHMQLLLKFILTILWINLSAECRNLENTLLDLSRIKANSIDNIKKKTEFLENNFDTKCIPILSDDKLNEFSNEVYEILPYLDEHLAINLSQTIFKEKEKRKLLNDTDIKVMYMTYVKFREIDKAKEFKKQYQDSYPLLKNFKLPEEIKIDKNILSSRNLVFDSSDYEKYAELKSIDFRDFKIVIFFLPSCQASENMMKKIVNHPNLYKNIKEKIILITPDFIPSSLNLWKYYFDIGSVYVMYNKDSFKTIFGDLKYTSYPVIFFVKDNKVIDLLKGFKFDKFVSKLKEYKIIKKDTQEIKSSYSDGMPFPYIGEITNKFSEDDKMNFIKSIVIEGSTIVDFDYRLLYKYYKGEDFRKAFDAFSYEEIKEDPEKCYNGAFYNLVSEFDENRIIKIFESFQIHNGRLVGFDLSLFDKITKKEAYILNKILCRNIIKPSE